MFTIQPANTNLSLGDADIQTELAKQIQAGNLPAPDDDRYYAINFPSGYTEIDPTGSASCQAFCAYHGTFLLSGQNIYYGVLPDLNPAGNCKNVCVASNVPVFQDDAQLAASHELTEAVTDADVGLFGFSGPFTRPLAWVGGTDQGWGSAEEIGDLCAFQPGTLTTSDGGTFMVQKEYDNATGSCIVTPAPSP
jgi:hypothetical protein